jgi:hypothetical protein
MQHGSHRSCQACMYRKLLDLFLCPHGVSQVLRLLAVGSLFPDKAIHPLQHVHTHGGNAAFIMPKWHCLVCLCSHPTTE